jgi:aerobic-type carbon monoxide dehydrogenase small subunit (CoxS/CutS family)
MVAALHADQADVWTAEGLESHPDPRAAAILRAKEVCEEDACGACLNAQAMTALTEGSSAASMVDVLCRCGVWHAFMERIEEGTGD